MEESRSAFGVLGGKPGGVISVGRPRRRWENNISIDLQSIFCDGVAENRNEWQVALSLIRKDWVP
jgi:hypothetical protein